MSIVLKLFYCLCYLDVNLLVCLLNFGLAWQRVIFLKITQRLPPNAISVEISQIVISSNVVEFCMYKTFYYTVDL